MSIVGASSSARPVGHQGARVDIKQRPALALNGWFGVIVLAACVAGIVLAAQHAHELLWLPIVVFVLIALSLVIVSPGQTSVVQFFGRYVGTVTGSGFWWVLPLTVRRSVSVRVRNFETNHLKVNDADGNPVEIAAIVVWQVVDTAKSTYAVENYLNFVWYRPSRRCAMSRRVTPTTTRQELGARYVARRTSSPPNSHVKWRSGLWWQESRSSKSAFPTWPTRRRSPRPCFAGNRPTRSSRRDPASSRAPSGWSRWPSIG